MENCTYVRLGRKPYAKAKIEGRWQKVAKKLHIIPAGETTTVCNAENAYKIVRYTEVSLAAPSQDEICQNCVSIMDRPNLSVIMGERMA